MPEEQNIQDQLIATINQVADIRLRIGDFIILTEGRFSHFQHLDLLEQAITSVRVFDNKLNDFKLTQSISCVIAETGHLISGKGAKEYRRRAIDWTYVYRNLFYVSTALAEYLDPPATATAPADEIPNTEGDERVEFNSNIPVPKAKTVSSF